MWLTRVLVEGGRERCGSVWRQSYTWNTHRWSRSPAHRQSARVDACWPGREVREAPPTKGGAGRVQISARQVGSGEVAALVVVVLDVERAQFGEVDAQRAAAVVNVLAVQRLKHSNVLVGGAPCRSPALRASVWLQLTALACWAWTASLNCSRAWNWLFLVKVMIFRTEPNLLKIWSRHKNKQTKTEINKQINNQSSCSGAARRPAAGPPGSPGRTGSPRWSSEPRWAPGLSPAPLTTPCSQNALLPCWWPAAPSAGMETDY